MPDFKIGDRVKVIAGINRMVAKIGATAIVTDFREGEARVWDNKPLVAVTWDDGPFRHGQMNGAYYLEDFVLDEPEKGPW